MTSISYRSVRQELSLFSGCSESVCACHGIRLSVAVKAGKSCRPQRLDAPCETNAVAAHPLRRAVGVLIFFILTSFGSWAAAEERVEERDSDGDGRVDTQIFYEGDVTVKMVLDRNQDGRGDETLYFKEGRPEKAEKDSNFDRKIDTWVEYDDKGFPSLIASDKQRKDGKPDTWRYLRNGLVYKREWDRNFDGKPDFRTIEIHNRLVEKQYDDDFDGRFEKVEKPPKRGSTGIAKTTAG
ncbi:MAG: hypothetical protein HY593_00755 [Candidatus Omnitrophica bacterium]|nr:hypothetical protein [Candidatus Omnitrophota bacterium]